MADQWEKAFDVAQDTVKLLLSMAVAVIAFTVTFLKEDLEIVPTAARTLLATSWLSYAVSILGGVVGLLTLAGGIQRPPASETSPSIYARNTRIFVGIQVLAFVLATFLLVIFGILVFDDFVSTSTPTPTPTSTN